MFKVNCVVKIEKKVFFLFFIFIFGKSKAGRLEQEEQNKA